MRSTGNKAIAESKSQKNKQTKRTNFDARHVNVTWPNNVQVKRSGDNGRRSKLIFWISTPEPYLLTLTYSHHSELFIHDSSKKKEGKSTAAWEMCSIQNITTLTLQLLFSLSPQTNFTPWSLDPLDPTFLTTYLFCNPKKAVCKIQLSSYWHITLLVY